MAVKSVYQELKKIKLRIFCKYLASIKTLVFRSKYTYRTHIQDLGVPYVFGDVVA